MRASYFFNLADSKSPVDEDLILRIYKDAEFLRNPSRLLHAYPQESICSPNTACAARRPGAMPFVDQRRYKARTGNHPYPELGAKHLALKKLNPVL